MKKKFEVFGKGREGKCLQGEGKCITYPVINSHIFAHNAREAEAIFEDFHPECDEILHRETKEIEPTEQDIADGLLNEEE